MGEVLGWSRRQVLLMFTVPHHLPLPIVTLAVVRQQLEHWLKPQQVLDGQPLTVHYVGLPG